MLLTSECLACLCGRSRRIDGAEVERRDDADVLLEQTGSYHGRLEIVSNLCLARKTAQCRW